MVEGAQDGLLQIPQDRPGVRSRFAHDNRSRSNPGSWSCSAPRGGPGTNTSCCEPTVSEPCTKPRASARSIADAATGG